MQINSNLLSLNAQRSLQRSASEAGSSMQRLSSGLRINSARDDAAGLAITERFSAGIRGSQRAAQNINDGISLLQVAEGAVGQIVNNFQRIRELAVQAANGVYSSSDRSAIQREVDQLVAANYQINDQTQFNQSNLLDGSFHSQFQVGANVNDTIGLSIPFALAPRSGGTRLVDVPLHQVNITGAVAGALAAGSLSLNGLAVGASVAGASPGQTSGSAYAVAQAINSTGVPGITATASNSFSGVAGGGGAIPNGAMTVNGIALGPISGVSAAALAASAAAAISGVAGASGVSASVSGATLTLTAADGRDIDVSGAGLAALGLGGGTHRGSIALSDAIVPGAHSISIGGSNPGAAGFSAGGQASAASGGSVQLLTSFSTGEPAIDLSSVGGATAALDYVDGMIDSSNALRTLLGATENRLGAAYGGAIGQAAKLAAARSRIRDTDYASETAQLTRAQILQQAGVAILAQANTLPGQALLLLR
ncbi:flagellin [Oxalobacteraceae bacterium]|nr:flagellin [Oxalobacteraceae bacterium]